MDSIVTTVLVFVYLGMILGNIPGLALNRSGIALLGAIFLIIVQRSSLQNVAKDIDLPTMAILFGLMILSAQFYYSGFYAHITKRLTKLSLSPSRLLLVLMLVIGFFSAVLVTDIVCLAMTPLLIKTCHVKRLNPIPFLLGLACSANIGSALTLIGNPQNILIGEVMNLSFRQYLFDAIIPTVLGLFVAWKIIVFKTKNRWEQHSKKESISFEYPEYNLWQSYKGVVVLVLILGFFIFSSIPREYVVLAAAGILLLSRRMTSKSMLDFVDWKLLVLFFGLFVVTKSFFQTGIMQSGLDHLENLGAPLSMPWMLFPITVILSNIISNVPAVMILLPLTPYESMYGALLALASTLAGNFFILGSIANIIVVTQSADLGVKINWKQHFKIGLPVTVSTLSIAALWLYVKYSIF